MQITGNFRQALQDYILLLEKKYPEKAVHELVSTRYALNHFERSILYRGIAKQETAQKRKEKLLTIEQLNHRTLHIDLFNVLFTLAAYLRGFPVYVSSDGLVRDASESHGSGDWLVHLERSLELLTAYLEGLEIPEAVHYVDHPMEHREEILEKLNATAGISRKIIRIITDPSPDHLIKALKEGVLATSDSTIIDKSSLPVIDLPRHILQNSFHREWISMENLLNDLYISH